MSTPPPPPPPPPLPPLSKSATALPPRPDPKAASATSSSTLPPPPIHQTTPMMPGLVSAPPSGNAVGISGSSLLSPLPPPPIMTGVAAKSLASTASSAVSDSSASGGGEKDEVDDADTVQASNTDEGSDDYHASTIEGATHPSKAATMVHPSKRGQQQLQPRAPDPPPKPVDVTKEPPPLPITTFGPKSHSFLASRQTHHDILIIATENAHRMAWKNRLRLTDMLNGLASQLGGSSNSSSSDADMMTVMGGSAPPFRSIGGKNIPQSWETIGVHFWTPADTQELDAKSSQELLQANAKLLEKDGNLVEELDLLEDRVDQLLQDTNPATGGAGASTSGGASSRSVGSATTSGSNVVAASDPGDLMQMQRDRVVQFEQITKDAFSLTSPPNIPWLWRFRVALDHSTNHLTHEYLHCPAIVLLVCTTSEPISPQECLEELSSHHYLPEAFDDEYGTMDPSWLNRQVLVLHDNIDGPPDLEEVALVEELKSNFGHGATLLRVNSIHPDRALKMEQELMSDLWDGGGSRGNCLSQSDRITLRNYMATLLTSALFPALERRVNELNNIVTERKKGVRNVFKSLWRASKEDAGMSTYSSAGEKAGHGHGSGGAGTATKYRHDSIESQVRLLADTLFLVGDYEGALSMYKLIKDDYKHDGAKLEYASVQEMMALSSYKLDHVGRAKEIFGYFETALFGYTRAAEEERGSDGSSAQQRPNAAPRATRLATRLCLVLSSARNMNVEGHLVVADLLASASSHETSLGAAVLLEQSSAHYYKAGMFRKYAFHMLMSGHMFRSAGQEPHAFRCFTSALYIYHDGNWDELHNHLRSALAAQLYSLGRMAVSVELYAKLVGTTGGGRVSTKSQQKFLTHLRDICRDHPKKALVGADRMAAPSGLARKERFSRVERVVRYTKGARRVLELPNMDLPMVKDSSIKIYVEAEAHEDSAVIPFLGKLGKGDHSVWEELEILTQAELTAHEQKKKARMKKGQAEDDGVGVGTTSSALQKIDDLDIRSVVAAMDTEIANKSLLARAKRNGTFKATPAVRARMEPLAVTFEMDNPLGIAISIHDIQLVGRVVSTDQDRIFTNEDAIAIGVPTPTTKEWTFKSSTNTFYAPMFGRISPKGGESVRGAWQAPSETQEPYFVVTKGALSLKPGSKQRITLSICPLVKGQLDVLGVRCRLFDDIWVYHPFRIQGPLLQDTREHKSTRARASPVLLTSRIEQDMPRLTVALVSNRFSPTEDEDSGYALEGQVSTWNLRVSNIGTATANNLSLKTNLPWVNVPGDHRTSEASGTSTCVGPSATLLLLGNDGLEPGETVEIPVQIRTTSTTQDSNDAENLYMLYRYEFDDVSTGQTMHRWLRQMIEVPIRPTLSLSATLMPSFWAKTEHILSVEVTNDMRDSGGNIVLDQLCIASRHYRLQKIGEQGNDTPGMGSMSNLDYMERVSMHYRLTSDSEDNAAQESSKCIISECGFQEGSIGSNSTKEALHTEVVDYWCLESAARRFQTALKAHKYELARREANNGDDDDQPRHVSQIRRANTSMSAAASIHLDAEDEDIHPTSIARFCPTDSRKSKIDILCTWSAPGDEMNGGTIVGQTHFSNGLSVRPKTSTKGCPITTTCQHCPLVRHDFARNGPAHVPLEITLRNRLIDASVEFEFAMERPSSFEFNGAECFDWDLEGGEELTIPVVAIIPTPGVFNLQHVRLTVVKKTNQSDGKMESKGKKVPYLFPLQWMVEVLGPES